MATATIRTCKSTEPKIIGVTLYVEVYIYCDLQPEFPYHVLKSAWVPLYDADLRANVLRGILADTLTLHAVPQDDIAAIIGERISL